MKFSTFLPLINFISAHNHDTEPLPPEHLDFGKCKILPGRNVSYAPPTTGFKMNIEKDFPNGNLSYVPECSKEMYPEAFKNDNILGKFENQNQNTTHPDNSYIPYKEQIGKSDSTSTMHVSSFHIPDKEYAKYSQLLPVAGPHRAMWAAYGEYDYVPPGRYMHNLEHGAIVFLYHPCADGKVVGDLKRLARGCLWKHVIGMYPTGVNEDYPVAILAWGRYFQIHNFNLKETRDKAIEFIKKYAKAGSSGEGMCWGNGGYQHKILKHAELVTGVEDKEICPNGFLGYEGNDGNVEGNDGEVREEHGDVEEENSSDEEPKVSLEIPQNIQTPKINIKPSESLLSDPEKVPELTPEDIAEYDLTPDNNQTKENIFIDQNNTNINSKSSLQKQYTIQKDQAVAGSIAVIFILSIIFYFAFKLGINCQKQKYNSTRNHFRNRTFSQDSSVSNNSNSRFTTTIGALLRRLSSSEKSRFKPDDKAEYVHLMDMDNDSEGEFSSISIE